MQSTLSARAVPMAPQGAPPVRVYTLGRFALEVAGEPLRFGGRTRHKPLELLKVLIALGGESVPLERLSEALWPDSDGDRAHSAFTTTLNRLRKLVGHETLRLQDGRLSLEPGLCWVDVRAFAEQVARTAQAMLDDDVDAAAHAGEAALALYQGPFLDGEFEPPELLSRREKVHGQFLRHVTELGRFHCERHEHQRAAGLFRRGLEADDLSEELYQHLMRCLLEQGRLVEGVSVYRRCREIFRATVGIDPSAETEALHQALLAAQSAQQPTPEPAPTPDAAPPADRTTAVAAAPVAPPPPPVPEVLVPAVPTITPTPAGPLLPVVEGERGPATVATHVLDGYGALSERLDPEEADTVLDDLHTRAEAIVARHGGTVNLYLRDELIAVYGMPQAHEDDPAQAVRAARELHDMVRRISPEVAARTGTPLALRTGIHTSVVVAQPRQGQVRLSGDAVDVGAHLVGLARPDDLLISTRTRRLVGDFFISEALPHMAVPGRLEPLAPWRITGTSGVRSRLEAAVQRGLSPFSGRSAELATLQACLERAIAGEGQLVTLLGEPGVGKSRLLLEFQQTLDWDRVWVHEGRAQAHGAETPYLPFQDALRRTLGLRGDLTQAELAERAVASIRKIDPALESCIPYLLHVLSLSHPEHTLPDGLRSADLLQRLQDALVALTVQGARLRPQVLMMEDWHWGDEASTAVLRAIVGVMASHPIILVVTSRPEGAVNWGPLSFHTLLALKPLDTAGTAELVHAALGTRDLPPGLVERIHQRTGGNPFFVEELCTSLMEEGSIQVTDGRAVLTGSLETLALPDTVQAVLRTRLDRLDPDARRTLRLASVVGREFDRRILERMVSADVPLHACLERLKAVELVQQTQVVPEAKFRFKHVLAQVVVYESLLLAERRKLHALVARTLETLYPDRLEEHYEALAYHYHLSNEHERALHFLELAGDKAAQAFALESARHYYRQAVERLDGQAPTPEQHRRRIDLTLKWAEASQYTPTERQLEVLAASRRHAEALQDQARLASVIYWRGRHLYVLGHMSRARAEFEHVGTLAEALRHEELQARCNGFLGRYCYHIADYDRGAEHLRRCTAMMDRLGLDEESLYATSMLAVNLGWCGRFTESFELYDAMIERARRLSNPTRESAAQVFLAMVHALRGDWAEACELARTGTRVADRLVNSAISGMGRWTEGVARFMLGEREAGLGLLEEIHHWQPAGRPGRMLMFPAWLVELNALAGDAEAARAAARVALAMREDTGQRTGDPSLYRGLAMTEALAAKPDWAQVEAHGKEALRLARHYGALPDHAITAYRMATLMHTKGDPAAARSHLAQANSLFREMDMAWWQAQAATLEIRLSAS